jgi:hypothetical protein
MSYVLSHDGEVCLGGALVPLRLPPSRLQMIDPHPPSSFAILAASMRVTFAMRKRQAAEAAMHRPIAFPASAIPRHVVPMPKEVSRLDDAELIDQRAYFIAGSRTAR